MGCTMEMRREFVQLLSLFATWIQVDHEHGGNSLKLASFDLVFLVMS
jgi:hypothetical protein